MGMVNIPSLLQEAYALHQSGRFDEADALYRHILQEDPQHADALHLSGLIMQQRGDLQAAVNLIQQAISGNANIALYHSSLGSICMDCGQWSDAQQCYQRSLQLAPGNSEAQDRLGFALANLGEFEQAEFCFREAIRLNPEYADAHFHRGLALGRLLRPNDAEQSFLVAVRLKSQWPEAWYNLGDTQMLQGHREDAEKSYRQVLRLQPANVKACVSLGNVLKEQQDFAHALEYYQRALQLDSECAEACNNMGMIFFAQNKLVEAIQCYDKARSINPDYAEVHMNMGVALLENGSTDDSIKCFQQALSLKPDWAEVHNNLGLAWLRNDEIRLAQGVFGKAVQLKPDYTEAINSLGHTLHLLRDFANAEINFRKAIATCPGYIDAYINLAVLLTEQGDIQEGLKYFRETLVKDNDNASAHWNYSYALLLNKEFISGWQEHEWRFRMKNNAIARHNNIPRWQGEELDDSTLLVYAEQGIGDEIRFANCLPDVIEQARHVVIECDPRLQGLYQGSFPGASVYGVKRDELEWLSSAPPIDLQIPAGSLPMYTRPCLDDFPRQGGYLCADPERVTYWEKRLHSLGDGPKVGIAWRGGLITVERELNYADFKKDWQTILRVPGVQFINMMYDECSEELEWARTKLGVDIHHFSDLDQFNDMAEVAALMSSLDLLVSAPLSVSEMAGALGVPVWYMIFAHHVNTLGTDHLPWFHGARCFFKERAGEWGPVTDRLAQELSVFKRSFQEKDIHCNSEVMQ